MSRGSIYEIARGRGVILRDGCDHSPTASRARTCFAKRTVRKILDAHGETHLDRVFAAILGDRRGAPLNRTGTATQLYRETLRATSMLLSTNHDLPEPADRIFDDIDLAGCRRQAIEGDVGEAPIWLSMFWSLNLVFGGKGSDLEWASAKDAA